VATYQLINCLIQWPAFKQYVYPHACKYCTCQHSDMQLTFLMEFVVSNKHDNLYISFVGKGKLSLFLIEHHTMKLHG
jgi:hypothetical protein